MLASYGGLAMEKNHHPLKYEKNLFSSMSPFHKKDFVFIFRSFAVLCIDRSSLQFIKDEDDDGG